MNYLKNLVEGKTATIISCIKLANANYNIFLNHGDISMFKFTERKLRRQKINDSFPHE